MDIKNSSKSNIEKMLDNNQVGEILKFYEKSLTKSDSLIIFWRYWKYYYKNFPQENFKTKWHPYECFLYL